MVEVFAQNGERVCGAIAWCLERFSRSRLSVCVCVCACGFRDTRFLFQQIELRVCNASTKDVFLNFHWSFHMLGGHTVLYKIVIDDNAASLGISQCICDR
jgi:hypothetical protein